VFNPYASCTCNSLILLNRIRSNQPKRSLSQKFASAIVRIDAHMRLDSDEVTRGTGFLVSPDGWIFTAAHVVIDPATGKTDEGVSVILSDDSVEIAEVMPIDGNMIGTDFAILKIRRNKLPILDLGDNDKVLGSDLTIIGYPFSAIGFKANGPGIKDKFCLSGTVAYSGSLDVPITIETPKKTSTVNVNVDVIYFQGPSIKGLSGAPIISRDTGHVVAILTSRLTGINESLSAQRQALKHPGVELTGAAGFSLSETLRSTIEVLDTQLANGLGAGTGIEDPRFALRSLLRKRHAQPQK
jgi:Trypsin-like peptidase domain